MDTCPRYLITTADERTWKFDRPVIFLGEWCRIYDRKHIWENMDAVVAAPYGLGQNQKESDHRITTEWADKLFPDLCKSLNLFHGVQHDQRFWRILLGHWFYRYVDVIFNRVKTLEKCLQTYEISGTTVFSIDSYSLAPQNTFEAIWAFNDDIWNNVLNAHILKYLSQAKFPIEIISNPSSSKFQLSENKNLENLEIRLLKWFRDKLREVSKLFVRDNDALIINTYLPKWHEVKLQLALGQFPQSWSLRKLSLVNVANQSSRNDLKKYFLDKPRLTPELVLNEMVFDLLPVCFLEGFNSLNIMLSEMAWPKYPRFIFTSNNFDTDELFKLYAANKSENGCLYFVGQHGNYGAQKNNENPSNEELTSDKFITWGWKDGLPQHAPAFIFKTLADKDKKYKPKGGLLLIELHSGHRLNTWDNIAEFIDYFDFQKRFVQELLPDPRRILTIRLHAMHKHLKWNEISRWRDIDSSINVNSSRDIRSLISQNRLVVHSYDSTGILETLSKNIPTLAFWPNGYDNVRKSAKPFYQLLVDAGIVHFSPESVANKINEIWFDVDGWWYQNDLQDVRVRFCERYARQSKNPIKDLIHIFSI
jgi:putative transferase (TIGR04331 family)